MAGQSNLGKTDCEPYYKLRFIWFCSATMRGKDFVNCMNKGRKQVLKLTSQKQYFSLAVPLTDGTFPQMPEIRKIKYHFSLIHKLNWLRERGRQTGRQALTENQVTDRKLEEKLDSADARIANY